jgi:hypothetical protein
MKKKDPEVWYVVRGNGKPQGAFSTSAMRRFAEAGKLLPTDLVAQKGQPMWVKASTVPEIFPLEPELTLPAARKPRKLKQQRWHRVCIVLGIATFLLAGFVFIVGFSAGFAGRTNHDPDAANASGLCFGTALVLCGGSLLLLLAGMFGWAFKRKPEADGGID